MFVPLGVNAQKSSMMGIRTLKKMKAANITFKELLLASEDVMSCKLEDQV